MLIYLSRSQIAITHGFHIKKDSVGQKKTKKNANPLVTQHQNNCLSACELAGSFIETMLIYERTAITYGFRSRRVRSGNKLRDLSGTTHKKKQRKNKKILQLSVVGSEVARAARTYRWSKSRRKEDKVGFFFCFTHLFLVPSSLVASAAVSPLPPHANDWTLNIKGRRGWKRIPQRHHFDPKTRPELGIWITHTNIISSGASQWIRMRKEQAFYCSKNSFIRTTSQNSFPIRLARQMD